MVPNQSVQFLCVPVPDHPRPIRPAIPEHDRRVRAPGGGRFSLVVAQREARCQRRLTQLGAERDVTSTIFYQITKLKPSARIPW